MQNASRSGWSTGRTLASPLQKVQLGSKGVEAGAVSLRACDVRWYAVHHQSVWTP